LAIFFFQRIYTYPTLILRYLFFLIDSDRSLPATQHISNYAPAAKDRVCLAEHIYPLTEDIQAMTKELQHPADVIDPSFFQFATDITVCGLASPVSTM